MDTDKPTSAIKKADNHVPEVIGKNTAAESGASDNPDAHDTSDIAEMSDDFSKILNKKKKSGDGPPAHINNRIVKNILHRITEKHKQASANKKKKRYQNLSANVPQEHSLKNAIGNRAGTSGAHSPINRGTLKPILKTYSKLAKNTQPIPLNNEKHLQHPSAKESTSQVIEVSAESAKTKGPNSKTATAYNMKKKFDKIILPEITKSTVQNNQSEVLETLKTIFPIEVLQQVLSDEDSFLPKLNQYYNNQQQCCSKSVFVPKFEVKTEPDGSSKIFKPTIITIDLTLDNRKVPIKIEKEDQPIVAARPKARVKPSARKSVGYASVLKPVSGMKSPIIARNIPAEQVAKWQNEIIEVSDGENDEPLVNNALKVVPVKADRNQIKRRNYEFFAVWDAKRSKNKYLPANTIKNRYFEVNIHSKFMRKCCLCEQFSDDLVKHYVTQHFDNEVYISRLPADIIEIMMIDPFKITGEIFENKLQSNCYFCSEVLYLTRWGWIRHFSSHTGEYLYKCQTCSMRTLQNVGVGNHRPDCTNPDVQCMFNIDFSNNHLYAYMCTLCNFIQGSMAKISMHLVTQHNKFHDRYIQKFSFVNHDYAINPDDEDSFIEYAESAAHKNSLQKLIEGMRNNPKANLFSNYDMDKETTVYFYEPHEDYELELMLINDYDHKSYQILYYDITEHTANEKSIGYKMSFENMLHHFKIYEVLISRKTMARVQIKMESLFLLYTMREVHSDLLKMLPMNIPVYANDEFIFVDQDEFFELDVLSVPVAKRVYRPPRTSKFLGYEEVITENNLHYEPLDDITELKKNFGIIQRRTTRVRPVAPPLQVYAGPKLARPVVTTIPSAVDPERFIRKITSCKADPWSKDVDNRDMNKRVIICRKRSCRSELRFFGDESEYPLF